MSATEVAGAIGPIVRDAINKPKGSHYKAALVVGLAIGFGLFGLWSMHIEPFAGYLQPFMVAMSGFVKAFTADLMSLANMAIKYAEANPIPAFLGAMTLFGTVYGIFSKISGDRALARTKAMASEQITDAHAELLDLSQRHNIAQTKVNSLQEELDTYKNDTSFQEAQGMISGLKSEVSQKAETIQELSKIIEDLKTKTQVVVH